MFIYSSVDECVYCFHILSIMNNDITNMSIYMFILDSVFNSLGYYWINSQVVQTILVFYKNSYNFIILF